MTADTTWGERVVERALALPPISAFPLVDELRREADALAAEFPGAIERTIIGSSRLGEEIASYAVGEGPAIVVLGGVHPNEPIGFHTALELLRDVAAGEGPAAEFGARWHIVPCIDPDGARLNESWFADPGDRVTYARGFYRPAPVEQVEWSFPLDHGGIVFDDPIPETRAAMALMDAVDPVFVTGLHNAELGGVYFYVSDDLTPAIEDLHGVTAALGLPLDRGEPEFAGVEPLADAVFPALSAHAMIDALVEMGVDPAQHVTAGGTADYAERFGASMLVAELPYWAHADADDVTESREKYRDVLARSADDLRGLADVLDAALDVAGPDLGIESQLRRASVAFAGGMRANAEEAAARALDPASDRPATVAEVFSNADNVRMFRLRFGSMLARTLHAEIAAGTASPAVRSAARDLDVVLEGWYAEAAERQAELETIPIERLVGVQLGAVLSAARVAVSQRRGESV